MISCFIYKNSTGRILKKCTTINTEIALLQCDEETSFIECDATARDSDCYVDVDEEVIKTKEDITPTVSLSEGHAVISGLPAPCSVKVEEVVEEVTGGTITIEFDVPGDYAIEITPPPRYFDKTLEVDIP